MARAVGIGYQNFEQLITKDVFYIDKTSFIREWWENNDEVTLIARPRRFGKTLNMSMLEQFLSINYADRGDLFEGLAIWEEEKYRKLQGTFPVIALSFANVKETSFDHVKSKIFQLFTNLYSQHDFLRHKNILTDKDREYWDRVSVNMSEGDASLALYQLSEYLYRYYHKKVMILLDEYDTPMQEAYVHGYWKELMSFVRGLFNAAFKTNPYLDRAVMTGITRVSRESVFSDLNNLTVVTSTSDLYADSFGFTEAEVYAALKEYGLEEQMPMVKQWYDGFAFGHQKEIYNPWSIVNYLKTGRFGPYWANTSSNRLAGKLIREGSKDIKLTIEGLLQGKSFRARIDEQIVYDQLDDDETAIWSLFLAGGYLKALNFEEYMTEFGEWVQEYELALTNFEVKVMFQNMIRTWFGTVKSDYNDFTKALIRGDVEEMNAYMNRIAENVFSSFDTGKKASGRTEPERFYHGFVLGLLVDLSDRYIITSNRESGFGRYDVQMEPRKETDNAVLIEFKVRDRKNETDLEATARKALAQIEEKDYAADLRQRGISKDKIRMYGFAFEGKTVLIRTVNHVYL
ncbi:MAG TPA: hypothetical protein DD414_06465 [Lachnospiraceae bacterium]|nr:hypothetical protein [Lachnospiraceae bacterium]